MPRRLWWGCRSVFLLSSYVAGRPLPPPQPAAPAFFQAGAVLPPSGRRAHCWTRAPPVCLISTHQSSEGSLRRGTLQRWARPETCLLTLFPEMRVLCFCPFFFFLNQTAVEIRNHKALLLACSGNKNVRINIKSVRNCKGRCCVLLFQQQLPVDPAVMALARIHTWYFYKPVFSIVMCWFSRN